MYSSKSLSSASANSLSSNPASFYSPASPREKAEKEKLEFSKTTQLAENGDPDAQVHLSIMFARGQGTAKNPEEVKKWLQLAAEKIETPAGQYAKGTCYANGYGVAKDKEKAIVFCRQSAEQGYALAQATLGTYYLSPILHTKASQEAIKKGQNFFSSFLANVKSNIGKICRTIVTIPNEEKAFYWTQKAAEQGLADAQTNLAYCYSNGIGVKKDQKEAFRWTKKAANQGDIIGNFLAGVRYREGCGTDADFDQAYQHLTAAANKGYQPAKDALTDLKKKVAQGQRNNEVEMQTPPHLKQS